MGTGFGVPFATEPEVSYYADVTLVSFYLPFGIFGLLMFLLYFSKLWSMVNSTFESTRSAEIFGLKVITVLGILISLNDDMWSHKEFSIVIALVISSFVNSYKYDELKCRG